MALLSRALLAKALLDKTTRQYAEKPTWGPYSYDKDIYPQARLAFPEYNKLYSTNEEFTKYFVRDLNNKNPKLLQKISAGVVTKEDQVLIDQFNQVATAEQVAAEPQQAEAQQAQPVGTATGIPFGGMGLPTVPSIPSSPRIRVVHKVPQAQVEGQKLFVADSSGTVVGVKEITPTSVRSVPQGPSEFHITDRYGNIVETYSKEPQKPPGTAKLYTQDKSGIIREHSVKPPSRFSAFRSSTGSAFRKVQNFASPLGPSIKKGLGGIGRGITGLGRAGLGAATPALGRMGNGLLNGIQRISQPGGIGGGGISKLSKSSNKLAFGLVGGLMLFVLLSGVIGGLGGTTPTGEAAPTNNNLGLDYTLPLRDTSIVVSDIRSTILKQWPNAKIDNWQIIIDQAKLQSWNPAVLLTLWIEESGAQGAASYTDALGCDVGKPTQDIQISLKCFFDSFNNKFTNDQFAQFILTYSAPNDPFPFKSNPNFPKNFKDWYSKLVPTGAGAIVAVTPSSAPRQQFVSSCPVPNGVISCGSSKGIPGTVNPCHCTSSYSPVCPPESRRGKALDIKSPSGSKDNDPVYMPLVNGRALKWYFRGDYDDAEGATLRVFQSEPTPNGVWTIHFVHSKRRINLLKIPDFTAVPVFSSGQEITDLTQPVAYMDKSSGIGSEVGIHTHVSIGLIGDNWYDGDLQYRNPGWKYADTEMNMCL